MRELHPPIEWLEARKNRTMFKALKVALARFDRGEITESMLALILRNHEALNRVMTRHG